MTDSHEGGCLCGAIRFEVRGKPLWVAHCHCFSCRRNTGAPVATFVGLSKEQFLLTQGRPATFASSPGVSRAFCATCGTPLTYEAEQFAGEVHVYVSAFDEPSDFVPTAHVHTREQISWLKLDDGLKRFEGSGQD